MNRTSIWASGRGVALRRRFPSLIRGVSSSGVPWDLLWGIGVLVSQASVMNIYR